MVQMASRRGKEVAVEVVVRVRPLLDGEKLHCKEECVKCASENQVVLGNELQFTFDRVLPPSTTQLSVYEQCAVPLVRKYLDGFNTTILAYGQTGTGKTFTLGSGPEVDVDTQQKGIIPRSLEAIFSSLKDCSAAKTCVVTVSYTEVYKEELRDLLNDATPTKRIQLREQENGNIVVSGITEVPVSSVKDALQCLRVGNTNRMTGSTKMNKRSSRSHAIFTIRAEIVRSIAQGSSQGGVEQSSASGKVSADGLNKYMERICPKFHFVDLAGSERFGQTGNEGERFKESIHINSGLLALGNVINALGEPKRKIQHVPYRDSKITRLLKDSLGGNAKTIMLACLSPASSNYAETLNTLKYAQRARLIKNKPIVNCDKLESDEHDMMKAEIAALKEELSRTRSIAPPLPSSPSSATFVIHSEEKAELKQKIITLEEELAKCRIDLATDEDMFADKMQQIENYQEKVMQLTSQNNELSEALAQAQSRERDLRKEIETLSSNVTSLEDQLREKRKPSHQATSQDGGDGDIQGSPPTKVPRRLDFTLKGLLSALSSKNDRMAYECHERRREKGDNGDRSGVRSDRGEGSGVRSGNGVEEADKLKQMKNGETAIDEELEKMLDRKRMLDQLEKDLCQRESALTKREAILAERDLLDAKRMRASQVLRKKQTKLNVKLTSLECSIREGEESVNDSGPVALSSLQEHLKELKKERDSLLRQHASLQEKIEDESFLSVEEERRLMEVTEWLEAMEAAIEYQDKQIASTQNSTALSVEMQGGGNMELLRKLQGLPPSITQHLFTRYLEKMIDLKMQVEEEAHTNRELKVMLKEKDGIVSTLERCLQHTRAEMKRRIALQQHEHKKEMRNLMSSPGDSEQVQTNKFLQGKLQVLEKELYYYKKTSRDLKRQLKTYSSAPTKDPHHSSQPDVVMDPSESPSSKPSQMFKGEQEETHVPVIKKSRKQLRQLSSEEVSRKMKAVSKPTASSQRT